MNTTPKKTVKTSTTTEARPDLLSDENTIATNDIGEYRTYINLRIRRKGYDGAWTPIATGVVPHTGNQYISKNDAVSRNNAFCEKFIHASMAAGFQNNDDMREAFRNNTFELTDFFDVKLPAVMFYLDEEVRNNNRDSDYSEFDC